MRILSLTCLVGVVLGLLPAGSVCKDEARVGGGHAWGIVPLEAALREPALESAMGFIVSGEDLLVVVRPDRAEALAGLLAARGGEAGVLGPRPALRLWTAVGMIPDETARELGLKVMFRSGTTTLFEADRDSAYRLIEQGFFIAEAKLRPMADLRRAHFGANLTEGLLDARPLTVARARFVTELAESVSSNSLRSRIRFLSYDDSTRAYRSRFAPRHEMRQEITPYLRDLLATYLVPHGGTVDVEDFKPDLPGNYRADDSIFVNVVASKAGRKTSAHYIVCAHYDAIAVRDPAWQASETAWMNIPTPGADDDATGTAALLETARLISGLDLDVGVKFIAFSGEELGLLGSSFYVGSLTSSDSIIAVINLDMVGYVEGGSYIGITYDHKSRWLSDLLRETAESAGLESETEAYDRTGIHNSDHASFWTAGTPAVMLADRPDATGGPLNPYYHTLADTAGTIDIDQVCDNTKLVVSFLARFAEGAEDTLSDISLTRGSVQWLWQGSPYMPLVAGDSVLARVRAVNLGGSMLTSELYRLQIRQGDGSSGRLIHDGTTSIEVLSGEYALVSIAWRTPPDAYGEVVHTFSFYPVAGGVESDLANNEISVPLEVMPPTKVVGDLHLYPNPVTDPAVAGLSFEIWMPRTDFTGQMDLWVFDLEGSRVGSCSLVRNLVGSKDIDLGENKVPLERVVPDAEELAPGLYICYAELKVTGESGTAKAKTKFAVAR